MHRLDRNEVAHDDVRNFTDEVAQTTVGDQTVVCASGEHGKPQFGVSHNGDNGAETPQECVVSVVCESSTPTTSNISTGQTPNGGLDLGLVSSPPTIVGSVVSAGESDAKPQLEKQTVVSESVELGDLRDADNPNYAEGGMWSYANEQKSRIFNVVQYLQNQKTGQTLLTQQDVEAALAVPSIKRYAWILHDKDVLSAQEAAQLGRQVGDPKGDHFHIVVEMNNMTSIGTLARRFGVPPNCVEMKKGRGVYWDLVEYLTHEHPKQQEAGKFRYPDEKVHSNISNWREQLDAHVEQRSGEASSVRMRERINDLCERVLDGELTIRQAKEKDLKAFSQCIDRVYRNRREYLKLAEPPEVRINYHISGEGGGLGKTSLAKLYAQSLHPDMRPDECYYVVSDLKVPFDNYDGQPVIIFDDVRAKDLIYNFDRTGVFRLFEQHPDKTFQNVKYGSVNLIHSVSIITSTESYEDFCNQLAGTYVAKDGTQHLAEDDTQAYRRFPFFNKVERDSFVWYMNQGFVDGKSYKTTVEVLRVEQNAREYLINLNQVPDEEQREIAAQTSALWFDPIAQLADKHKSRKIDLGMKDKLLAAICAPGKLRKSAAFEFGLDAYFDLGDGVLRRASELSMDQIDGLAPVPDVWVEVARARFLLEVIEEEKVRPNPDAEWVKELRSCEDALAKFETTMSNHPLVLGDKEQRDRIYIGFLQQDSFFRSEIWHGFAMDRIRAIQAWLDSQGSSEVAA